MKLQMTLVAASVLALGACDVAENLTNTAAASTDASSTTTSNETDTQSTCAVTVKKVYDLSASADDLSQTFSQKQVPITVTVVSDSCKPADANATSNDTTIPKAQAFRVYRVGDVLSIREHGGAADRYIVSDDGGLSADTQEVCSEHGDEDTLTLTSGVLDVASATLTLEESHAVVRRSENCPPGQGQRAGGNHGQPPRNGQGGPRSDGTLPPF